MAASAGDVSRTLKEALIETLGNILSPVHEVRLSAEEQFKVLEVTDEFGVHLAELTVDQNGPYPIRQLASVLLKQYVEVHWSSLAEKFRPPETTEEAKAAIRHLLPIGLREPMSKVRSSVAYAISAIAHWDWPEAWPQLFDQLMQCLTSEDKNAVHGAMRVLTEFSREVTDIQMPQVVPVILPEMYKIFTSPNKYGIRTRGRAVEIFTTCSQLIVDTQDYNKGVVKSLLHPILPQFTEALVQALQVPDSETSDSGLKKEIIGALTFLVKNVPKQMAVWLPHILTPVWNALTESAAIYIRTIVNNTEEADDGVDSDGEVLGFENLVFSIFDFVNALVETPKFRGMVKQGISDLMYYIILYMQITEEQIRAWTNSPDQFVEDEDDDTYSYSVRISAQDLLLTLWQELEDESADGLCAAISKHLHESEANKNSGNPHWWKIHEACLMALGSVKDGIIEKLQANELKIDLAGIMQSVVLVDLNLSVSPFLIGRCLWLASRFAVVISPDMIQRFLQATISGLQASQATSVRISAVRAVWGFCEHLKRINQTGILAPYLPPIMEGLMGIATQFSSEVLSLVLEAITIVISIDKNFTASVEGKVSPLAIAVFLRYNSDPVVVSLAQDIFKELCENPACQGPIQQRLLPTLVSIFNASTDKIPIGIQGVSMDILQTIVRSSSHPLPDPLIVQAFPAAVHCILRTDDNTTLQNGGECIRAYVSVALDQIIGWHDDNGCNGLYYVVQVAQHLLDPKVPESSAAFVGRLVSMVISKASPALGENTDLLLRAVLSKMQQTKTLSVIQSLVMIFAHLIHTQMEAVLEFLSGVPGPTGKSALHFVLLEWCSRQHLFFGSYEKRVSTLALCHLLEHGVKVNDQRLMQIQVKGDQIFSPNEKRKTRSSKNSENWTEIPVLVKIYKLLINELSSALEAAMARKESDNEDSEEEEWDDESEMDDTAASNNPLHYFAPAEDYLGYDEEDVDDCDDPDAVDDPAFHVNLQTYLTNFLKTFSQHPSYSSFAQHHTPQEKQVLQSVGIVV